MAATERKRERKRSERDRGKRCLQGLEWSSHPRKGERGDSVHPSRWERNDREGTKDVIRQMDSWWVFSLLSLSFSVLFFFLCFFFFSSWLVCLCSVRVPLESFCLNDYNKIMCLICKGKDVVDVSEMWDSLKRDNFGGDQRANTGCFSSAESMKHYISHD